MVLRHRFPTPALRSHSMEEPDALVAHVRICAGGASNWAGGPTAIHVHLGAAQPRSNRNAGPTRAINSKSRSSCNSGMREIPRHPQIA